MFYVSEVLNIVYCNNFAKLFFKYFNLNRAQKYIKNINQRNLIYFVFTNRILIFFISNSNLNDLYPFPTEKTIIFTLKLKSHKRIKYMRTACLTGYNFKIKTKFMLILIMRNIRENICTVPWQEIYLFLNIFFYYFNNICKLYLPH